MPDVNSIPFRQAAGNGHYESKQLPNDNADFLTILGLPTSVGNVTSASVSTLDGQVATYWGTSGSVIKASTAIGVATLTDGVLGTKPNPAGDIVGTTAVQTLTNKTIVGSTITGATGISKTDVGLGNVDNTSDANKPVSGPQQTALNLKEDKVNKGVVNGYAALDAGGKVPAGQLPSVALGGVTYQGLWNALSNTPVMPAASAGNKGWYYVVSIGGSTMVDGVNEWALKDWIVSNGSTWDKIDNTDAVTSVAGRMGAVVLTKTDVGLDQVDNTSDATKNAAAVTLTNKTINGNNNTLAVRLNADVTGNLPPSNLDGGAGASIGSFWRGDGHWGTPAGGGDVAGPGGSVDGELALYNGVSGTILKRSSGTGIVNVTNGVFQTPIAIATIANRLPRNSLAGLAMINGTDAVNDINITVGECRDDSNTYDIRLASILTKQLDAAWVAGTAAGGRDTGAIADATWHVFVILNPTTGVVDALFSQSLASPTMPSGFTAKRRVGSVIRRLATIVGFLQQGDYFSINAPMIDTNDGQFNQGQSFTLAAVNKPLGLTLMAHVSCRMYNNVGSAVMTIHSMFQSNAEYVLASPAASQNGATCMQLWLDSANQYVAANSVAPAASITHLYLSIIGYWDHRGRQD